MAADVPPIKFEFDLIKSNFFRVVYAEGAWGGVSPRGKLNIAFYNERSAIPTKTALTLVKDGTGALKSAGPEEIVSSRNTIVRELEVEVVMDLAGAVDFYQWLGERIEQLKAAGVK